MTDTLLTDREVTATIGCSRTTLWRWARQGKISKPLKIGGMSRWRASDVDAFIAKAVAEREAA